MGFVAEEKIDVGPDLVWRHLTEPDLMSGWMPGIDGMRTIDGAPLTEGSGLAFRSRGAERSSDVVHYREKERLALRSKQGPVTATYTYHVKPHGEGTHVRLEAECRARGPMKLLMPLIRYLMRRADSGQLKHLKEAATKAKETAGAPPETT
jgi:uncharacterized protein YndB with AHSA1/START domain